MLLLFELNLYDKLFLVSGETLLGLVVAADVHTALGHGPVSERPFNCADPEGAVGERSSESSAY